MKVIPEEEFEDTKRLIKISKSKKDRHNNCIMAKRPNDDLQNTTQKTKDRATRTPLRIGGERRSSRRVNMSCSNVLWWGSCSLIFCFLCSVLVF